MLVKSHEMVSDDMKVLHLAYHMGEHYSSIRMLGDEAKAPAEPIPLPENIKEEGDENGSGNMNAIDGENKDDQGDINEVTEKVEGLHVDEKRGGFRYFE